LNTEHRTPNTEYRTLNTEHRTPNTDPMSSYPYFISTLPSLTFGETPPMSCEEFIENSREWISPDDWQGLKSAAFNRENQIKNPAGIQWKNWEETLKNYLAAARAAKLGKDQTPYLSKSGSADSLMRSAVQEAVKAENQQKAEEVVDKLRWSFLDELSATHSFDFNVALSYLLKLKILERWASLDEETGKEALNKSIVKQEK